MNRNEHPFSPCEILLPQGVDMTKWSVVACDQYTSQPQYWQEVDAFVGDAPSTLRMIIPELYLEESDVDTRITQASHTMEQYLQGRLLRSVDGFVYLRRTLRDGRVRRGLVGAVDLECYDFAKGTQPLIRATEGTVLERIPPRVRVRKDAPLELPHVMLLIDDPADTVLGPLDGTGEKLYDFPLMQDSGAAEGFLIHEGEQARILQALSGLADPDAFSARYGLDASIKPILFAVGDGNHSLATAKTCYENLKKILSPEEASHHPARYALVEVVNLHDASLQFEPIHRVVFDVDPGQLTAALREKCRSGASGQTVTLVCSGEEEAFTFDTSTSSLAVGTLQIFLDTFIAENGGRVDYIHGDSVVRELSQQPGAIGFLVPGMGKDELFRTVALDGALPRKTFSMGHAWDKRFYLECRKIK